MMQNMAAQCITVPDNMALLVPDSGQRKRIRKESLADIHMCWTCGSCDAECPVNIATGRLRPQKIVRIASLGFLDELLHTPEIWYCLTCRRCMHVCPNAVSPATLIDYARRKALFKGTVSRDFYTRYTDLFERFQRVRWHVVQHCLSAELDDLDDRRWDSWQGLLDTRKSSTILPLSLTRVSSQYRKIIATSPPQACFTCGECSSACPISCGRSFFDPRTLFRMVNLGMLDELIRSPSIWLCIECGRCTESCSQRVDGRELIKQIKELAIQDGVLDLEFKLRLEKANRFSFRKYLKKIETLLNN